MQELATPEYARPGVTFECSRCETAQSPNQGDGEAALLIGGLQRKLCVPCARELLEEIDGNDA